MTVEGIKNFQIGLTQYLSSDEAVFINDAKTHKMSPFIKTNQPTSLISSIKRHLQAPGK